MSASGSGPTDPTASTHTTGGHGGHTEPEDSKACRPSWKGCGSELDDDEDWDDDDSARRRKPSTHRGREEIDDYDSDMESGRRSRRSRMRTREDSSKRRPGPRAATAYRADRKATRLDAASRSGHLRGADEEGGPSMRSEPDDSRVHPPRSEPVVEDTEPTSTMMPADTAPPVEHDSTKTRDRGSGSRNRLRRPSRSTGRVSKRYYPSRRGWKRRAWRNMTRGNSDDSSSDCDCVFSTSESDSGAESGDDGSRPERRTRSRWRDFLHRTPRPDIASTGSHRFGNERAKLDPGASIYGAMSAYSTRQGLPEGTDLFSLLMNKGYEDLRLSTVYSNSYGPPMFTSPQSRSPYINTAGRQFYSGSPSPFYHSPPHSIHTQMPVFYR